jgi:site-specific DNA-methyltransferase (adenine-specific)
MIELLNTDCMEYMKGLEDNAFELAIVDPPYGIGESGKTNKSRGKLAIAKDYKSFAGDDLEPPNKDYFLELKRVSKNQIIWGANHFMQNIALGSSCWVVWDKLTGESDFADCELAYTSFKTAVRKFQFRWSGMLQGDMKNKEHRIHPTQKPVKLYEWLLSNYAKEGERILDTHLGSGSSAIAAHYGGYDFVGCELDEDYYKAASVRFDRETAQVAMF